MKRTCLRRKPFFPKAIPAYQNLERLLPEVADRRERERKNEKNCRMLVSYFIVGVKKTLKVLIREQGNPGQIITIPFLHNCPKKFPRAPNSRPFHVFVLCDEKITFSIFFSFASP